MLKSICIFGAGSAGWLTALSIRNKLPEISITLLSSNKNSNIGVGESTQPNLVQLLQNSGINLYDFMKNVDVTLKHGIFYKNWNKKETSYWHPFTNMSERSFYTPAHFYQQKINEGNTSYSHEKYYKEVHSSYSLCVENNLSSVELPFAFHIDANKMADYIENFLREKIKIIKFDDYDVKVHDNKISKIICDGHEVVADLYIDCSGFNKVLISKVSDCKTDEYKGRVNTALFGRVYYDSPNVINHPYTKAEAHDCGWTWVTPLQSKVGSGWIYNDLFSTEETAKQEFVKYWGGALKEENIRKVKFSSESLIDPWVTNVVSIGLSSGFIEPLEATGISWFIISADILGSILRNRYFDKYISQRYNTLIRSYIEDVQDFVDVHYCLSSRLDSEFWKTQKFNISDRLKSRLENYRKYMPNKSNRDTSIAWGFNDVSWIDILNGYEFEYEKIDVPDLSAYILKK